MYDHRQDWCIIVPVVQLCFIKNNGQRRYKYLVLGRDTFYFAKTLWFSNLLFLVVVFFNRKAVYLWVHTIPLFSPTRSLIRMRQILYRDSQEKWKKLARCFNLMFCYIDDVLSLRRAWRYQRCDQRTQWPKEQWSTKHTHTTKDRVTRTPLKTVGAPER